MAPQTITLGTLVVNRLGFGAMRVIDNDNIWGEPTDRQHALKVLRRAHELGANFFDTAESYGPHTDETLIAEALHPYPKGLVITTKCGLVRPSPGRWDSDARPEKLKKDLEGSLKRLKLERIDLYQLHAPDPKVPLEESIGAMVEFQKAGKVRHIGVSNFSVKQIERARKVATIVSVQNQYNYGYRKDNDVVDYCTREGIAFLPWYPLGDAAVLRNPKIKKVAERTRTTPARVAIAWLLARSPAILPIPGTGSIAHLEENMKAAGLKLSAEDVKTLG
jgi:aryl-alcohol dehydrogenase-like predicted oxidoreductase